MKDPIHQIREDWKAAKDADDPLAGLCALSTVSVDDGRPRVRTLVLWDIREEGVVLLTNNTSPKWHELRRRPCHEVMILWTSVQKQYRLRGEASGLPDSDRKSVV